RLRRVREAAALVRDRPDEGERLRVLLDLDGLLEERLRARELALEREERAEREVRQECVGLDRDGLLQRLERLLRPAGFVLEDAGVDERLEVPRLALEHGREELGGALRLPFVERGLAEVERELGVRLVELERLLERAHGLLGVERVERELGVLEERLEALAPLSREAPDHPLLALE